MGNVHLVTGYAGTAHVASSDDGSLNAAIFGEGQYVLNRGNRLQALVTTNNNVRILDGDIMLQGRHIRLEENTYVDLTIESGTQSVSRNDLIVARYTKNTDTGVEDCNLVVIKGTASTSNPVDPDYIIGDLISDGSVQADMPLYRIPIIGVNIQTPVSMFTVIGDNLGTLTGKQDDVSILTEETAIVDGDYFPFLDVSAAKTKKTKLITIINKIKSVLTPADIGALPASTTAADIGALPASTTAADIGAAASSHTHSEYLSKSAGGTVSGAVVHSAKITLNNQIVLNSNSYGTTLPAAGTKGRIFFKKL